MSFMDKMKFWKKDEIDLDLDDPFKSDLGSKENKPDNPFLQPLETPNSQSNPLNENTPSDNHVSSNNLNLGQPLTPQEHMIKNQYEKLRNPGLDNYEDQKTRVNEFDLILSKLDTIKAMVDNLNQRLTIIEEYLKRDRFR